MRKPQPTFESIDTCWADYWKGMPECVQEDLTPFRTMRVHFENPSRTIRVHFENQTAAYDFTRLIAKHVHFENPAAVDDFVRLVKNVHFENQVAVDDFARLVEQKIGSKTKYIWHPEDERSVAKDLRYVSNRADLTPRYPIYIPSKGRFESCYTMKALDAMNVPYHVVVEPQEFDQYAAVIDRSKILVLPFSNLGRSQVPARNWIWEHAISTGAERHWQLDDNIYRFCRLNRNMIVRVADGAIFKAAEDFVDRFENVANAGFQYFMFVPRKVVEPPFARNRRIYSIHLIKNDIPFRFRGTYNDDTDFALRLLKAGRCTILFYAFLADKATTMTVKGGNTDEYYQGDGRLKMAQSLQEQHPYVARVTRKFGRDHHHVNYDPFEKNQLKLKPGLIIPEGVDNYGMTLQELPPSSDDDLIEES